MDSKKVLKALAIGYVTKEQLAETPRSEWYKLLKTPCPCKIVKPSGVDYYSSSDCRERITETEYRRLLGIHTALATGSEKKHITEIQIIS